MACAGEGVFASDFAAGGGRKLAAFASGFGELAVGGLAAGGGRVPDLETAAGDLGSVEGPSGFVLGDMTEEGELAGEGSAGGLEEGGARMEAFPESLPGGRGSLGVDCGVSQHEKEEEEEETLSSSKAKMNQPDRYIA